MARQGKLIVLRGLRPGMPASEIRHQAELVEHTFAKPADVIVLNGDLIGTTAIAADPAVMAFARRVRDRLGYFLEMIDRCDVLFFERVGDRLIFLVCAQVEEHLTLIRDAIAGEHLLLAELGIDRHDVEVRGDVIRVVVPAPGDSLAS